MRYKTLSNKTPPREFITDRDGVAMRKGDRLLLRLFVMPDVERYTLVSFEHQAPGHWLGQFRPYRQRHLVTLSESDFVVYQVGW